jgi:antitoxin VapB
MASPDHLAYALASVQFKECRPMRSERHVRLFRNGRNQALRIPRELELDADEATIRKDGERLIVEPVKRRPDLATLLASWDSLDEPYPDVDEGLLPLDDIRL